MMKWLGMLVLGSVLLYSPFALGEDTYEASLKGTLSHVTQHELYVDHMKFLVDRHVIVVLHKDDGPAVSMKSLAAVGRVERAKIYLTSNVVKKIVVLNMQQ